MYLYDLECSAYCTPHTIIGKGHRQTLCLIKSVVIQALRALALVLVLVVAVVAAVHTHTQQSVYTAYVR